MPINKSLVALLLLTAAATANAATYTITQTFNDLMYSDFGAGIGFGEIPTGDWIFRATLEADGEDLSPVELSSLYALTSLTFTQESIGAIDVRIVNVPYLYFTPNAFGFTSSMHESGSPMVPLTETFYGFNYHFAGAKTLAERIVLIPDVQSPAESGLNNIPFAAYGIGFQFEDGRALYGSAISTPNSTITVSVVPEPSSAAMMILGFGAVVSFARRSRS
ncbi:PEP-CTERM -sorting domain protein [Methyloversatilis sp. RAC08]|uniref:PEP-CTERM sorting domain-containing protein n=1 Tax=Methyloversatilis sp. RAC08 TaxID=1842540 RepID=UPI00083D7ED2|nr:PEP-CTERM sorting domain-containing protein [Methyloversatilis sp. RAC08]AOF81097.1 PEP-CTERM -sorting domain protein [Methyloversatilis sp. RAC08]